MSFLTKLPTDLYDPDAFKQFIGKPDFAIEDARAFAWLSQLSYETDEPDKIGTILKFWGLDLVQDGVVVEESKTVLPQASTHCFVASGPKVMFVAFAGTDPVSLANWITNFNANLKTTGAAEGYTGAADVVWPRLKALLEKRVPPGGKVFVTGHSLGGALAVIIADRIATELKADVGAVYTFGMPRPGSQTFADSYNQHLGARTFRLVHGEDLVPTVAPTSFNFAHLGRLLHCERQGKFDRANLAADTSSDFPPFSETASNELTAVVRGPLSAVLSGADRVRLAALLLTGMGMGMRNDPAGVLIELLPPRIRDHIPDRYIAACRG